MKRLLAVAAVAAMGMGCGGSDSPTSPSGGGGTGGGGTGGGGGGIPDAVTVTISANGVADPRTFSIRQGGRVTMVNTHNRNHDMSSDPHPSHVDCPELNQIGFLTPGQSRTSGNLNTVRTCGFHDHENPGDTNLQGRITIVQ